MKIVDAVWEKRNLGVDSIEIVIEQSDNAEAIAKTLETIDAEYQVIRAPVGRLDLYQLFQRHNFSFAETMYHAYFDFIKNPLDFRNSEDDTGYKSIESKEELNNIYAYINDGMFKTDRVSLDPYFDKYHTANRYCGMLDDKLEQGAEIFYITENCQNIGFFAIHEYEESIYDVILTGLFPPHQGKGLGKSIVTKMLECAKNKNAKLLHSHVSANNQRSFELHIKYGFQSGFLQYLFVKHIFAS